MPRFVASSGSPLRRGWTTGACATAAAKAAFQALCCGEFPDPVEIELPGGLTPSFALALEQLGAGEAVAGIVKDAGDDPDVTHGVTVIATVRAGAAGTGVRFLAGAGVGTVTLAGLPLALGEPAINPVPRRMISHALASVAERFQVAADVEVEISIPGGEAIAAHTWNPRLGILGGLSILGTTGIVIPYSCSAWIDSIRRGVDVGRAAGLTHLAGCTGSVSETAVRAHFDLPELAMIDMGDFAGGLLKYIRRHPVGRLTIGGGFAKLSKLARGHLDLHSGRSEVDVTWLAGRLERLGCTPVQRQHALLANTALEVLSIAAGLGPALALDIALQARSVGVATLRGGSNSGRSAAATTALDIVVVDREGAILAASGES